MLKEVATFHSGKYIFSAEISEKTASMLNAVSTMYSIPILPDSKDKIADKISEKTVYNILKLQKSSVTFDQVCRIVTHNRSNFSQDVQSIETINTYFALNYIEEQYGKPFSHDLISKINNELSDNLPTDESGKQYRKGSIFEGTKGFTPPASALDINFLLKNLTGWLTSKETADMHPVIKGILTHLHILKIQPFKTFNQSTAMIAEIFVLKSLGMNTLPNLLPQIYAENRDAYKRCAGEFLTNSSIDCFTEFVCTALIEKLGTLTSDNMDSIRKNTIKAHLDSLLSSKQLIKRQHAFLSLVLEKDLIFSQDDLQVRKPFTTFYGDVSRTTATRDIKKFIEMKLLRETEGRLVFNEKILSY